MTIRSILTRTMIAGLVMLTPAVASAVDITWYGQAAFKITSPGGKVIVIDPFITKNPKTPEAMKDLGKIGKVDLILITHGHGDHIGDLKQLAEMTGAKIGINADMGRSVAQAGWASMKQMVRFNKSGPIKPIGDGITVTMTHAEHSSIIKTKDANGNTLLLPGGEPSGYIIKLEDGYTIYHAGDTGVFGDMKFIGEYYKPDLALIPIGGHFTMDPAHAAYAMKNLMKPKIVMPMHYGTFGLLKGTPDQLIAAMGSGGPEVVVMQPGDSRKF